MYHDHGDHKICISSSPSPTVDVSTFATFCFLPILLSSSSGADRFFSAGADGAVDRTSRLTISMSSSGEASRAAGWGGRLGIVGTDEGRV